MSAPANKAERLAKLKALNAKRRAVAIWEPDPEPSTIQMPSSDELVEDFSDLGDRDLVTAFDELTKKGRGK